MTVWLLGIWALGVLPAAAAISRIKPFGSEAPVVFVGFVALYWPVYAPLAAIGWIGKQIASVRPS